MAKPCLLDLFCGAGGAAMGYYRAGFDVVGVDIKPQPHYPFTFIQGDALNPPVKLSAFDVIHASPPCQAYSTMTKKWGRELLHPDLVPLIRLMLRETGLPYVIENVRNSGLDGTVMLCGSIFNLPLRRHRYFQLSNGNPLTLTCNHSAPVVAVYGHSGGRSKRDNKSFGGIETWKAAMEIDWMSGDELAEAIPPAYTEFIGRQLMEHIR